MIGRVSEWVGEEKKGTREKREMNEGRDGGNKRRKRKRDGNMSRSERSHRGGGVVVGMKSRNGRVSDRSCCFIYERKARHLLSKLMRRRVTKRTECVCKEGKGEGRRACYCKKGIRDVRMGR